MRNYKQEKLKLLQRQYHRNSPWRLEQGGLYIPHEYTEEKLGSLSWWDDVGFILNKRRIIVWWQHPRLIYADELDEIAWQKVGDGPQDDWLMKDAIKNYKQVGKSRKKIVSYTVEQQSDEQQHHYEQFDIIRQQLAIEGIEAGVVPSYKCKNLAWAVGVSLIVPMEVHNKDDIAMVANLAKRLILRQTTLDVEFPGYCYNRDTWLSDQKNATVTG